ncbi:LOW QUALITY PROTEIN: hypothetical protein MAR_029385 [Mya arenaria]|uniref:Uncharacterized protein n=1 Tax=Mya arenaria TaxID=6604 RepID=A0ABY7DNW5_MYAAR|nr:LOW QUALITY PROTEIN: hypothetical protein MAR_029385 [Mya arenaria]
MALDFAKQSTKSLNYWLSRFITAQGLITEPSVLFVQHDQLHKVHTSCDVGFNPVRADPVITEDQIQMWEKDVIDFNSAKSLSRGVFLYNSGNSETEFFNFKVALTVILCTRLHGGSFDEQATMSRSGHGSTAVRDYKQTSTALSIDLSATLQPLMVLITATATLATTKCEPKDVVSKSLSTTPASITSAKTESGQNNAIKNIQNLMSKYRA